MKASKYIFLSFILYFFAINFAFANDDTLMISSENETSSYQNNNQSEKIIIHGNKKTENINKIQFKDDNPDEEIIKIEQNNHKKNEFVSNRKTHSNIKKNNNLDIIEDDLDVDIASDSRVVIAESEVKNNTADTLAASSTINNKTASGIAYEAKLIEFNVQDKTKHIENKEEISFNYNNLLYYLLYVFSLFFIFCLIGLIKEIINRRKSKMKVAPNEKSN